VSKLQLIALCCCSVVWVSKHRWRYFVCRYCESYFIRPNMPTLEQPDSSRTFLHWNRHVSRSPQSPEVHRCRRQQLLSQPFGWHGILVSSLVLYNRQWRRVGILQYSTMQRYWVSVL